MTILDDIVKNTRQKLIQKKADAPLEQIKSQLKDLKLPKGNFKENLLNKDPVSYTHLTLPTTPYV